MRNKIISREPFDFTDTPANIDSKVEYSIREFISIAKQFSKSSRNYAKFSNCRELAFSDRSIRKAYMFAAKLLAYNVGLRKSVKLGGRE